MTHLLVLAPDKRVWVGRIQSIVLPRVEINIVHQRYIKQIVLLGWPAYVVDVVKAFECTAVHQSQRAGRFCFDDVTINK